MALTKKQQKKRNKKMTTDETAPAADASAAPEAGAAPPSTANGNGEHTPKRGGRKGGEEGGKRTRKSAPFKILHQQQGYLIKAKKYQAAVDALPEDIRKKFLEEIGTPKLKTCHTEIATPEDINSTGAALKFIKKSAKGLANKNIVVAQFRDRVRIEYEKKIIEKTKAKLRREGDPKPAKSSAE